MTGLSRHHGENAALRAGGAAAGGLLDAAAEPLCAHRRQRWLCRGGTRQGAVPGKLPGQRRHLARARRGLPSPSRGRPDPCAAPRALCPARPPPLTLHHVDPPSLLSLPLLPLPPSLFPPPPL